MMTSRATQEYYIDTSVLLENTPHPGLGWCIFHILTSEDIDNYYTLNVWSRGKQLDLFSRES